MICNPHGRKWSSGKWQCCSSCSSRLRSVGVTKRSSKNRSPARCNQPGLLHVAISQVSCTLQSARSPARCNQPGLLHVAISQVSCTLQSARSPARCNQPGLLHVAISQVSCTLQSARSPARCNQPGLLHVAISHAANPTFARVLIRFCSRT